MRKNHSQDIVSTHDHARYTISLFAKTFEMKQALWAIYAFNYEVAKTREIVSDTTLGLIRLTWWREALNMIYGKPTEQKRNLDDHPILPELAAAITAFDLPFEQFDKILLGREFDLEDTQPQTLDGLLTYLDSTNAPLITLTAQICGLKISSDIQQSDINSLARASGLAGLLHAIPYHAQHQIVMLPSALIAKDDVLMANQQTLPAAIKQMQQSASNDLASIVNKLPRGPLRAIQKLTRLNINHITKAQHNPAHNKYGQNIAFLALKLAI